MPDRTKEELAKIYLDLIKYKKVVNKLEDMGRYEPSPDGVDRYKAFYQSFADEWINLLKSNTLKSCEGIQGAKESYENWSKRSTTEYSLFRTSPWARGSHNFIIGDYTIDKLMTKIKKVIDGSASPREIKKVNRSIDKMGNCDAIAAIEIDMNELEKLASEINGIKVPPYLNIATKKQNDFERC